MIGFEDVPRIRDRDAASDLPELAMLSVLAHPELEIAEVAIGAIASLPEDRARLYLDVIMNTLPQEVRRVLEVQMIKNYEYRSDFARRYYGQGREEGRQEGLQEGRHAGLQEGRHAGLQEGRQAGLQEGRQAGLRAAVIALVRARLDELPTEILAAIEGVSEPRVLTELVTVLGRAHDAAEARAMLDRALHR